MAEFRGLMNCFCLREIENVRRRSEESTEGREEYSVDAQDEKESKTISQGDCFVDAFGGRYNRSPLHIHSAFA